MRVQFLVAMTLTAVVCNLAGCTKVSRISVEECRSNSKAQIVGLITIAGDETVLRGGCYHLSEGYFIGTDANDNAVLMKADSVTAVEVRRTSRLRSLAAAAIVVSGVAALEVFLYESTCFHGW